MKIVFVHGRSQEKQDEARLRDQWLQAAIRGMRDAGLAPPEALSEAGIALPYYGDLLFDLTEQASRDAAQAVVERGAENSAPPAEELEFTQALIFEAAESNQISRQDIAEEAGTDVVEKGVQNWPAVLAALRLLDKVPGVGASLIELVTRDVWLYLTNKGIRLQVDAVVGAAIPDDEPCVVVAHSLGTVVAYNLLMNRQRGNVRALVTLGSPLGIEAIWKRLPSDIKPRRAPAGVPHWFNARDRHDTVALRELSPDTYRGDPIVGNDSSIDNGSENHHGIAEYLRSAVVARALHAALA